MNIPVLLSSSSYQLQVIFIFILNIIIGKASKYLFGILSDIEKINNKKASIKKAFLLFIQVWHTIVLQVYFPIQNLLKIKSN